MKILVAYSCDIQYCSGGHPEWHIKGNVLPLLDGGRFITCDFKRYEVNKWDMIIAFPPCTDLASSGARWFKEKQEKGIQQKSIEFFLKFTEDHADKIAIEKSHRYHEHYI